MEVASAHEPSLSRHRVLGYSRDEESDRVHGEDYIAAGVGTLRKSMPTFSWAMLVSEALGR
jgi:hypothetical protein